MRFIIAVLALVLCSSVAVAQPTDEEAALAQVERLGRDLYEHDRAAWLTTDAAMAELTVEQRAGMRGWITERDGNSVIVTFVAADGLNSAYRAVFREGAIAERALVSAPLTERQLRLYAARNLVASSVATTCAMPYNLAVIERDGQAIADAYLIPASAQRGVVRVGGFQRVAINLESNGIVEQQAYSNSCLELTVSPPRRGEQGMGLFFTHTVTPLPTETHVFLNLTYGEILLVMIEQRSWVIAQGEITTITPDRPRRRQRS